MIETKGLIGAVEAADVMVKTANVAILWTYCQGGKVARMVGDVEPDEVDAFVKTSGSAP
jgi:microcompartment protein CcmL/EutN